MMKPSSIIHLIMVPLFSSAMTLTFDLPWWFYLVCAFIFSVFFHLNSWKLVFLFQFIGTFLTWLLYFYWINAQNQSILMSRLTPIFHLTSHAILFWGISISGGLLAAISGALGAYLRSMLRK